MSFAVFEYFPVIIVFNINFFVIKDTIRMIFSQFSGCVSEIPEVRGASEGRPISILDCSSGTVCIPYQSVCAGLAAGKPCASRYHCTHTVPPTPAGTERPLCVCLHFIKIQKNLFFTCFF